MDRGLGRLVVCWPLHGQARSHRIFAGLEGGDVPVGAGVPAKSPVQVYLATDTLLKSSRPNGLTWYPSTSWRSRVAAVGCANGTHSACC